MSKTAVILFTMGGPDHLKAVRPFLFNLFNDRSIMDLPQPLRYMLASIISLKRAGTARSIYRHIGGKSPILENTMAQAEALEQQLRYVQKSGDEYKTFVCMRYWHPMSDVVVKKVKAYEPDHIIMLPLYPQFSTTTTASSFSAWEMACKKEKLEASMTRICCYPADLGFVASQVRLIKDTYWKASEEAQPRVLFSAHGLPEKIINKGDPYRWQIEKTVDAVTEVLAIENLDYSICYQSRIGPLKWIGPSTSDEIIRAGKDKVPVVVVPIAFVSEHSETLVELDIEYRKLAEENGVPGYWRVPTLGTESLFIETLADLCVKADRSEQVCSFQKTRYCSRNFEKCPCEVAA